MISVKIMKIDEMRSEIKNADNEIRALQNILKQKQNKPKTTKQIDLIDELFG